MARSDMDEILRRSTSLGDEIKEFVSYDPKSIQFRADLAGLLVVAMAASYETCVKETLVGFATKTHSEFGNFIQNHYEKLNSRISLSDLFKYTKTFDARINARFRTLINSRKDRLLSKTGIDFTASYQKILDWRHAFAHTGARNTTVEEALQTHLYAKRVPYLFHEAFNNE